MAGHRTGPSASRALQLGDWTWWIPKGMGFMHRRGERTAQAKPLKFLSFTEIP